MRCGTFILSLLHFKLFFSRETKNVFFYKKYTMHESVTIIFTFCNIITECDMKYSLFHNLWYFCKVDNIHQLSSFTDKFQRNIFKHSFFYFISILYSKIKQIYILHYTHCLYTLNSRNFYPHLIIQFWNNLIFYTESISAIFPNIYWEKCQTKLYMNYMIFNNNLNNKKLYMSFLA